MAELKRYHDRARTIRKESGVWALFKTALRFILLPVYEHREYNLFKYPVRTELCTSDCSQKHSFDHVCCKFVYSNQEADQLEKEGFYFRNYSTDWNYHRTRYRERLDAGAIACCSFVDKEFAAIIWIITSVKTQKRLGALPIRVKYAEHDALARGVWVNPRFRKLAMYNYNVRNLNCFLAEKGIKSILTPVDRAFEPGMALMRVAGCRSYGRAEYHRFFGYVHWKEFYDSPQPSEAEKYVCNKNTM